MQSVFSTAGSLGKPCQIISKVGTWNSPKFSTSTGNHFWELFGIPKIYQWTAKGASGKGPRQKKSKIVKKCQKYFRQFSTFFAQGKNVKNRQKCQKYFRHFSTIFARHQFSGPFWGALKLLPVLFFRCCAPTSQSAPVVVRNESPIKSCWGRFELGVVEDLNDSATSLRIARPAAVLSRKGSITLLV